MAKVSLSKSGLQKEKQQLRLYTKLLPSLDLKRTQLRAKHAEAKAEILNLEHKLDEVMAAASEKLPMLANRDVNLDGLVKISSIQMGEESVVGVKVPVLKKIEFAVLDYSIMAKPVWVDAYVEQVKLAVEAQIRVKVMRDQEKRLAHAVRRITQHVNLFEKILIPAAKKNIQKIQIILNDVERTAVVRSKISKAHGQQSSLTAIMDSSL